MTNKEQQNEWHSELRLLCDMFLVADLHRKWRVKAGEPADDGGINYMDAFRQHFAKVSLAQNSEMDSILGYEEMIKYAKWYTSDKGIFDE